MHSNSPIPSEMSIKPVTAIVPLVYPQWGRFLAANGKREIAETTQSLQLTLSNLERVQRQGSAADARTAAIAAEAYQIVIGLLAELDQEFPK